MLTPICVALVLPDCPPGFRVVDRAVFDGARGPEPEFHVEELNGRLRVETLRSWNARIDAEQERAGSRPDVKTFYFEGHRARWWPGFGTRVDDGWLAGYDRGEFGGGLFWFSKDGRRRQTISEDNTQAIANTASGIYAFQSLEHLGSLFYSHLIELRRSGSNWETRTVAEYPFAPSVVALGPNEFVYAKSDRIGLLLHFGGRKDIYRDVTRRLAPNSIVAMSNGDFWVGCAFGLLRLRPKGFEDYAPAWFLPVATSSNGTS